MEYSSTKEGVLPDISTLLVGCDSSEADSTECGGRSGSEVNNDESKIDSSLNGKVPADVLSNNHPSIETRGKDVVVESTDNNKNSECMSNGGSEKVKDGKYGNSSCNTSATSKGPTTLEGYRISQCELESALSNINTDNAYQKNLTRDNSQPIASSLGGDCSNESNVDFVSRIHRELSEASFKRRSLSIDKTPSMHPAPPYLHTSHRGEERSISSQLRLLHDSDLKIILDPMDLPIFTEKPPLEPVVRKPPKIKSQETKEYSVDCTIPQMASTKSISCKTQNKDSRHKNKAATKRIDREETSTGVNIKARSTATQTANPVNKSRLKSSREKVALLVKKQPPKGKAPMKKKADSSLQCSLIKDPNEVRRNDAFSCSYLRC